MPKKTTILIIILAVVTALLVVVAITEQQKPLPEEKAVPTPTKEVSKKSTSLIFSQNPVDASSGLPASVDILADTTTDQISGIQIELLYDPKLLTNVRVTNPDVSLFGKANDYTVLFNEVNPSLGRISYALAISPTSKPINGSGKIATITFQKQPSAIPQDQETVISFIDKTMVTKLNEIQTVLDKTNPLTVTLVATPTATVTQINNIQTNPKMQITPTTAVVPQ